MKKAPSHRQNWFINRVGQEIIKLPYNLFNPPITIKSEFHARALYISQSEKGYQYDERTA